MRDVLCQHERRDQVMDRACFSTVRSEGKYVHSTDPTEGTVKYSHGLPFVFFQNILVSFPLCALSDL